MANSDYKKPHSSVQDLLPSVYGSEVNKAVSRNVFDRFLSKNELVNIVGSLTNDPTDPLRLPEIDVHRQNHQLQPLLYKRIATVDHISSFKDIIREVVRSGANYERLNEWLSTNQFNFSPPIDIDKIVNYQNYFWFNNSEPQYITIKNRFNQLQMIVDQAYSDNPTLQALVDLYLIEEDSITKQQYADQIEAIYPGFVLLIEEYDFNVRSQVNNIVKIDGWDNLIDGVQINSIDLLNNTFQLEGNFVRILDLFYGNTIPLVIQGSVNAGTYTLSSTSTYNPTTNLTTVPVVEVIFDDADTSGIATIGNYDFPLDGLNIIGVAFNSFTVSGQYVDASNTLQAFDIVGGPNAGAYTTYYAEYDVDLHQTTLFVYESIANTSSVVGLITGFGAYDAAIVDRSVVDNLFGFQLQNDPWSQQNEWVHISQIPSGLNLGTLQQAQQPIIEYEPFIEMNEWSCVTYNWVYSAQADENFESIDVEPSDAEVLYFNHSYPISTVLTGTQFEVFLEQIDPGLAIGSEITINYDNVDYRYYTIENIVYDFGLNKATITVDQLIQTTYVQATVEAIRYTSQGNDWKGFHNHWVYQSANVPVPCENQQSSLIYDPLSVEYQDDRVELINAGGSSRHWYQLHNLFVGPTDDVRVYINDVRVYGTFALGSTSDGINFSYDTSLVTNAIWFFDPILSGVIRIETGPGAFVDEFKRLITVRTDTTNASTFESISLVRFLKTEQIKHTTNQYPLFNMFNLNGTSANQASPLWMFQESNESPVNEHINKRIVVDGNTFYFNQLLLDDDNSRMFAYKLNGSLKTVWRTDSDNLIYTPQYKDVEGNIVPIGDPDGDWELPKQMINNLEHENRKYLSTVDLLQHFSSILNSQPIPPGYTGPEANYWRLLSTPAYGAGGTIKEFSDGFDTFLSSVFVKGVTTTRLIDFAKSRYQSNVRQIGNIFKENIVDLMSTTNTTTLVNFQQQINDFVIRVFEEDDFLERVTGDTTMYDPITGYGVRNLICTLPKFGLVDSVIPSLVYDDNLGLVELTHHDGHVASTNLPSDVYNTLLKQIRNLSIANEGALVVRPNISNGNVGEVFYAIDTNQLFKNVVSSYGAIAPTSLPDGAYWYDTTAGSLKQKENGSFIVVPDNEGWMYIDLNHVFGYVMLDIEQRLYDVCENQVSVYPVEFVRNHPDFNDNEYRVFLQYAAKNRIASPLANSQYDISNAFSWNYSYVSTSEYRVIQEPSSWGTNPPATWYQLYEDVFGTRYPQAEPWVLQNYSTKPIWWDEEYAVDPLRRWSTQMWDNILNASVPFGREYPNGSISSGVFGDGTYVPDEGIDFGELQEYETIPVNTRNYTTADGLYQPDDLLPPYYSSNNVADADIILYGAMLSTLPDQNFTALSYTFGQNGPTEDSWRTSIEYLYDLTSIAYVIDPMRFVYFSMGSSLNVLDSLQVDIDNNTIPSHRSIKFHGDIIDGEIISVNGFNQWYVNYHRYKSSDLDISDFRPLWTDWSPVLSYQTTSFIDARSVDLSTDTSQLDNSDYQIRTKQTPGFNDYFLDSMRVVVASVGSNILRNGVRVPTGNGADWQFRILTSSPSFTPLRLYGVHTDQTATTFSILNGTVTDTIWNHYPIDKTVVMEFLPGTNLSELGSDYEGVQGLINFIDGYAEMLRDAGFVFNDTSYAHIDDTTGRVSDWQLESEKMIQQIYSGMVTDQLPIHFIGKWNYVIVDINTDIFTASAGLKFSNVEQIQFHSTGTLPQPLQHNTLYQVMNVSGDNFQVAEIGSSTPINITTMGRGTISIGVHKTEVITPQSFYEVNPFRNVIVFNNDLGVIANIQTGSFEDIVTERGIYDQYGRPVEQIALRVYRGDERSVIRMVDTLPDDINTTGFLHIGGMHLFLDGYEHAILFSNTSLAQGLLFDEFLGTQINQLHVNYRANYETTFRPNVGGRFVLDDALIPNIEAHIGELQHMYDAHLADEDSEITKAGRKLLGFETTSYFNELGITPKSQFLFFRGMIQQKGSINAVKAFINLRQFIDANVDDYWAYKVAEFGDSRQLNYPKLNMISTDTYSNKLLLQFITDQDPVLASDHVEISLSDDSRWNNLPEQVREIFGNLPNMHFELTPTAIGQFTGSQIVSESYIRLPISADGVEIVVEQNPRQYHFILSGGNNTVTLAEKIVPNATGVEVSVSRDGSPFRVIPPTHYIQDSSGLEITVQAYLDEFGTLVQTEDDDEVLVVIKNAVLIEQIHYNRVNSQVLYFDSSVPQQNMADIGNINVYCFIAAESKLNPIKLVDNLAGVTLNNITLWDPARGHDYHNAKHIIDISGNDPAYYTNVITANRQDINLAWHKSRVGIVWKDDTMLSYKPYSDNVLYPSIDTRLELWGQLEDWSSFKLYEWVESPVPPIEYAQYIEDQQDAGEIQSGVAKSTLYKRYRNGSSPFEFDLPWIELFDLHQTNILPLIDGVIFNIDDIIQPYLDELADQGWEQTDIDYVKDNFVEDDQPFNVYRDGVLIGTGMVIGGVLDITTFVVDQNHIFSIVIPAYQPTEDDLSFDPEVEDDLSFDVQYKIDYKYTQITKYADNGIDLTSVYYFWVSDTATSHSGLTLTTAEQQLVKIPDPYAVLDHVLPSITYQNVNGRTVRLPMRYSRCAIRGLVNRVTSDNRFYLRFTRDFTLRDDINDSPLDVNLKNKHIQWKMFRQRQKFNIDRYLWDRLTEACSGRSLIDSTKPIPSLDYVLYDEKYGTSTRFGMAEGQAFADKNRAIQILINAINDPEYDLYPVEREQFLTTYSFDTPEQVEEIMNVIYETFLPEHVNRLWFVVLFEALASNTEYNNIFKTSWVQLDGVRLLDASGVLR